MSRIDRAKPSTLGALERLAPPEAERALTPLLPGGRRLDALPELPPMPAAPRARTSLVADAGATTDSRMRVARVAAPALTEDVGATTLADRAAFERLARRDDVPGAPQVREVKFLMLGVDGENPQLYLINTQNFSYHWDFATRGLGKRESLETFNSKTYFRDDRKNVAGSIVLHDSFVGPRGKKGLFAVEFWPTDPVKARHVGKVYAALKKAMPWATGQLAYHPAGNTQEALFEREKSALRKLGVKSIASRDLFANLTYAPMNLGEGFGTLRVVDPAQPDARPPTVRDIVIFKSTPNDLSHVGGIITEAPQTPLSHINLKAKQNATPNAYVKDAANDPRIAPFLGKLVHFRVGPDGFELREATPAEAEKHLESKRPKKVQRPPRSLATKRVTSLDDLGFADAKTFGAKVANLAELRKILPPGVPPSFGFGVPFSFYDRFMKETGLYDEAKRMLADPNFAKDAATREAALSELRKKIKKAKMPEPLAAELREIQQKFQAHHGDGTPIRCRSSTNNEDLPGFNGAGLYDSFTHRADEGDLDKTIKQVYASLWNFRAFEEREFHRIDHFRAAMGVLLHKNEDDEKANGVAYTKNIYDPNWPGFYVNAQVGEQLVTNPGQGMTPDEFLISRIGEHGEYETQYISRSNQLARGQRTVLTEAQTKELVQAMEIIQAHFKGLYRRAEDPKFAMDIEFKIRVDGTLQVKQARPTVD